MLMLTTPTVPHRERVDPRPHKASELAAFVAACDVLSPSGQNLSDAASYPDAYSGDGELAAVGTGAGIGAGGAGTGVDVGTGASGGSGAAAGAIGGSGIAAGT
jgi:hypothetical protein